MHPLVSSLFHTIASDAQAFQGIDAETALKLIDLPESSLLDLLVLARLAHARSGPKLSIKTLSTKVQRTAAPGDSPQNTNAGEQSTGLQHFTCGIISAKTGRCSEDCAFCAQSAHHNTNTPEHPLTDYDTLARRAEEFSHAGVLRFGIVTSGNSLTLRESDLLCEYATRLRRSFPLHLCASLGRLSEEQAKQLRQAGFTRYHHNVETSASYYPAICTTHSYEERLATIRNAQEAGLEVCAGGIFGLGESWRHRVEMAFTLRDLGVNSLPLNFLNPIPGTPLAAQPALPPQEALRCIALFRLVHPSRDVLVCGGREFTLGQWQPFVFAAGANGIMVGNYLTTSGSDMESDRRMLDTLGLGCALAVRQ